jgi:hypothetical protein
MVIKTDINRTGITDIWKECREIRIESIPMIRIGQGVNLTQTLPDSSQEQGISIVWQRDFISECRMFCFDIVILKV